jgi:ribonuclease HII
MNPSLHEEKKLWKKGFKRIACLDEAGRGPLAGPVTAAAVTIRPAKLKIQISRSAPCNYSIIKKNLKFKILLREVKDSKKLTAKKREELYKILIRNPAIEWGIGKVSEKVIDKINIKNAAELAMEKALNDLEKKISDRVDFLIIDGKYLKNYKLRTKNYKLIVKADEKVFSCSVASIIAKVTRDRIMERYDEKYPKYGFTKHKGYPTKLHFRMLKKYGPCKIHRKSFRPVKTIDFDSYKR